MPDEPEWSSFYCNDVGLGGSASDASIELRQRASKGGEWSEQRILVVQTPWEVLYALRLLIDKALGQYESDYGPVRNITIERDQEAESAGPDAEGAGPAPE